MAWYDPRSWVSSAQDWFSGGSADLSRQEELADIARRQLMQGMESPTGPGARELAARQAQRQAMQQILAQTAGLTGAEAAIASQRQSQLAPVLQQQAAEQAGIARAGDVEARNAYLQQLFGQALGATGMLTQAEEAERQRRATMRQGAVGGLLDLGTQIGKAYGGGGM